MKLLLTVAIIFSVGCSTIRQSYADKKNDIDDPFIEVGYLKSDRSLLLDSGTLFFQKKGFLGFWKLRKMNVDLELTQALFEFAKTKEFEAIPKDLDNACGIKITKKVPPAKYIDFVSAYQPPSTLNSNMYLRSKFHQPTHRIYTKELSSEKEIIWNECYPFSESELMKFKKEIESDSTITTVYEEVVIQNETIKNRLALLNTFLDKFYSLYE